MSATNPATNRKPEIQAEVAATTPWRATAVWTERQRKIFRVACLFFMLICIPMEPEWYQNLLNLDLLRLHYRDLYDVARFQPSLEVFTDSIYYYYLFYFTLGYGDWLVLLLLSLAGAAIWSKLDTRERNYDNLYYWLRVIVRYRAAIGIIGFGFTKVFPVQMPYPSLGLLNTRFGDMTAQKLYWLSVGIVPWYEVFGGIVELLAGVLLLFRRTTSYGALLLFAALGDITAVNFAYAGGVHVYASYFVILAAFLLWYDISPVYNLLIREKFTVPQRLDPVTLKKWVQNIRILLKTSVLAVFIGLLGYLQYVNFRYDPYKQPATKGVYALRGNYQPTEFTINGADIKPEQDTLFWQDVAFEKWPTLTFRINAPLEINLSNGGGAPMRDLNRNFELTGAAGGKRIFHYDADTLNQILYLQDKLVQGKEQDSLARIPATATIRDEYRAINPRALSARRQRGIIAEKHDGRRHAKMILHYKANKSGSHVVLEGRDDQNREIRVVLTRVNRKYKLEPGGITAGLY